MFKKPLHIVGVLFCVVMVFTFLNDAKHVRNRPIIRADESPRVQNKVQNRKTNTLTIGSECKIDEGLLSIDEKSNSRLTKLLIAEDKVGVAEMVVEGKAFIVPKGTRAKILAFGLLTCEVRVMEGYHFGRSGFLPTEFVMPVD